MGDEGVVISVASPKCPSVLAFEVKVYSSGTDHYYKGVHEFVRK